MSPTWFLIALTVSGQLECDEQLCPTAWVRPKQRGDSFCDLACNTASCGFDSISISNSFFLSDCFEECSKVLCFAGSYFIPCTSNSKFGNGVCWEKVATAACGWDAGLCGYCAHDCERYAGYAENLGDGECQEACNVPECSFDAGDCSNSSYCATGCTSSMLGDGDCQQECLTPACENDKGDCEHFVCSAGCFPYMVGDGKCQESCHVEACQWDRSDCDCSEGCTSVLLSNSQCDLPCNNAVCEFDQRRCVSSTQGDCAAGCFWSMVGNGVCEPACFTEECEWDQSDCGCAADCLYSEIAECKPQCLVLDCGYGAVPGYAPCANIVLREAYKFQNIATFTYTHIFPAYTTFTCNTVSVSNGKVRHIWKTLNPSRDLANIKSYLNIASCEMQLLCKYH